MIKIFAPGLITDQQWLYADIFMPLLLPTLNTKNIIPSFGRSDVEITPNLNIESVDLKNATVELSSNETRASHLNDTLIRLHKKRSLIQDYLLKAQIPLSAFNLSQFNFTSKNLSNSYDSTENTEYDDYYDLTTQIGLLLSNVTDARGSKRLVFI